MFNGCFKFIKFSLTRYEHYSTTLNQIFVDGDQKLQISLIVSSDRIYYVI